MRLFLFIIPMILVVILQFIVHLNIVLVRKKDPEKADRICYGFVRAFCRMVVFLSGAKVQLTGKENLIHEGPVLYVANHQSIFDIVLLYANLKDHTIFIGKKEIEKVPLLSTWMRLTHSLFLDRENLREGLKTILAAIDLIKEGYSVAIFPEGTRNKAEDKTTLLEFHGGSFKPAEKANVPVIPIVFHNTSDILEDHAPWVKAARVKMAVMEPVIISDLDPEQKKFLSTYVSGMMQEKLNELSR